MFDTKFVRKYEGFTNSGYLTAAQFKARLLSEMEQLLNHAEGDIENHYFINCKINLLLDGLEILNDKAKREGG